MIQPDGAVAVCFEAAALTAVLLLPGRMLERRACIGTIEAIRAFLDLVPQTARRAKRMEAGPMSPGNRAGPVTSRGWAPIRASP